MNDESVDLSALDPTRDRTRFDAIASAIAHEAMAARARYEPRDLLGGIAGWMRPALLAAGIVVDVLVKLAARRWREVHWLMYVLAVLFVLRYALLPA